MIMVKDKKTIIKYLHHRANNKMISSTVRRLSLMRAKALELGFDTILEAEDAGYSVELKNAYDSIK